MEAVHYWTQTEKQKWGRPGNLVIADCKVLATSSRKPQLIYHVWIWLSFLPQHWSYTVNWLWFPLSAVLVAICCYQSMNYIFLKAEPPMAQNVFQPSLASYPGFSPCRKRVFLHGEEPGYEAISANISLFPDWSYLCWVSRLVIATM